MSSVETAAETPVKRLSGGFWRRAIALLVDVIAVGALVLPVAILAYPATNGAIRMEKPIFVVTRCDNTNLRPSGLNLPADFRVDQAVLCISTFAGAEVNRFVRVSQTDRTQSGGWTTYTHTAIVTPDNKDAASALFLDGVDDILLMVLLGLSEAVFGTTLGKRLLDLRVVSGRTGARSFSAGIIRNLLLYGSPATMGASAIAAYFGVWPGLGMGGSIALLSVLAVWLLAPVIALIFQRPDPFYDVWAGAKVVRR